MFSLGSEHRYFLYRGYCDMRKGFDGLCGLVTNELGRSPVDGSVYVFLNRYHNQIKLLHWEHDGLVLYQKRLERGRYSVPNHTTLQSIISWPELVLIVEGINYVGLKKKPRYELKKV